MKFKLISAMIMAMCLAGTGNAADLTALTAECDSCHGPAGASGHGDVPIIGGQTAEYIRDALNAFQVWDRPCIKSNYRYGDTSRPRTDMCKVTEGLTDTDFQALADHYSAQPFVSAPQEFDESRTALGSELYASGCQSCHGEGARGGTGPRLAGQWKRYLLTTLEFVPTGEHMVPSMMERKLGEFSPDQVHALLDYLASQQD